MRTDGQTIGQSDRQTTHYEANSRFSKFCEGAKKINLTELARGCGPDPPTSLKVVSGAEPVTAVKNQQDVSTTVYFLNSQSIVSLHRTALLTCALMRGFAYLRAALLEART